MKTETIIIAMALLAGGTGGLVAWGGRPADAGELKREKAEKIMRQTYGEDWFATLVASGKTNRAQVKVMADTYETVIGYHKPK